MVPPGALKIFLLSSPHCSGFAAAVCSSMDPLTISILSAIAATGADILIKFLKPHVVTFLQGVLARHQQQRVGKSCQSATAAQILEEKLNKRRQEAASSERNVSEDDITNERLHITMSISALKQHRFKLRSDLAEDVRVVSISGLGGRGKSSLLQAFFSHHTNNQGQCY
jgi:ABC-type transport system involved in cytochrome bd biosynthesis fused ATPase/permease subunit